MSTIARRTFVKNASIAAAVAGTAGIANTASAQTVEGVEVGDVAWDYETEVLVCGLGGAGGIAAIEASDGGAKVMVIEKQPADTDEKISHTPSTRLAYGCTMNFNSEEEAITYLHATSRGATPDDVIEEWSKFAPYVIEYLDEKLFLGVINVGVDQPEYPADVFPEGQAYYTAVVDGNGAGLMEAIKDELDARAVEVLWETPAKALITNDEGVVVGVKAVQNGSEVAIKATKAVILATGGFEYNDDMLNQYIFAKSPKFYCNPDSTGDGIRMAQAVGADLWHMGTIGGRLIPYFEEIGIGINGATTNPYILVDHYGKRFMNEVWKNHSACLEAFDWSTDLCDYPAIPAYSIMDQTAIDAGPIVRGAMLSVGYYDWSADNSVEIEKGWILKANTLEELAEIINKDPEVNGHMDGETLANTVAAYNSYVEVGEDPDFNRPAENMVALATPPFYAVKLYPGGVNTFGGPRRNAKGQIVHVNGNVIPHLYGAGEMGSIQGFLYSGGGWNFCELITSGQIAGINAAAETPCN